VIAWGTLDIRAGRELLLPAVTHAGQSRVSVESSCLERSTQRRGLSNEGQRRENIAPLIAVAAANRQRWNRVEQKIDLLPTIVGRYRPFVHSHDRAGRGAAGGSELLSGRRRSGGVQPVRGPTSRIRSQLTGLTSAVRIADV
jgi:hypothetical protein